MSILVNTVFQTREKRREHTVITNANITSILSEQFEARRVQKGIVTEHLQGLSIEIRYQAEAQEVRRCSNST